MLRVGSRTHNLHLRQLNPAAQGTLKDCIAFFAHFSTCRRSCEKGRGKQAVAWASGGGRDADAEGLQVQVQLWLPAGQQLIEPTQCEVVFRPRGPEEPRQAPERRDGGSEPLPATHRGDDGRLESKMGRRVPLQYGPRWHIFCATFCLGPTVNSLTPTCRQPNKKKPWRGAVVQEETELLRGSTTSRGGRQEWLHF